MGAPCVLLLVFSPITPICSMMSGEKLELCVGTIIAILMTLVPLRISSRRIHCPVSLAAFATDVTASFLKGSSQASPILRDQYVPLLLLCLALPECLQSEEPQPVSEP